MATSSCSARRLVRLSLFVAFTLLAGAGPQAAPAAPTPVSIIVTGGIVVTMDGQHRVLSPGAVAVPAYVPTAMPPLTSSFDIGAEVPMPTASALAST